MNKWIRRFATALLVGIVVGQQCQIYQLQGEEQRVVRLLITQAHINNVVGQELDAIESSLPTDEQEGMQQ